MSNTGGESIFGRAIDVHGHMIPQQLFEENHNRLESAGVSVEKSPTGETFLLNGDHRLGPIQAGMSSVSKRLEWMDERGIFNQWVSPGTGLFTWTSFDESQARIWYELVNSSILEAAKSSNGRLSPLVALYLGDPERAAAELKNMVNDNKLTGVFLSTHPLECGSLADPPLWPFWSAVERLGVPVMLHPPTNGPSCQITPVVLQNITGRLIDTTSIAAEMLLNDFFSRFPNVKIILVHGGGMLPYQIFRMDGLNRAGLVPQSIGGRAFTDDIRNFYYDTVALDSISLEFLLKRVGAGKVLLGSDAPFTIADPDPVGRVLAAEITYADQEDICCNNASRLALH